MKNINPTNTQAWKALETHQSQLAHTTIADLFKQEENRFNDYSLTFENQILVDFSKNKINQEIWFGIRPENIGNRLTNPDSHLVSGKINIVEQMGNEEFIYFSLGDTQYSCRIPVEKSTKANFNQTEQFYFNMEKCHIFDLETEENLTL